MVQAAGKPVPLVEAFARGLSMEIWIQSSAKEAAHTQSYSPFTRYGELI